MTFKRWLLVITLAALALLIFLAWHDVVDAFNRLSSLNVWVLLLMVPVLALFYLALSKFFSHFFTVVGSPVRPRTLFASMLELSFVNHIFPSGGLSGFSYLTMRLKAYGVSTAKSTLAQISRFGFAFLGQIGLMFLALFLLAAEDKASSLIVLLVSVLVFSLLLMAGTGLFIVSSRHRGIVFAGWLARVINRLIRVFRPKKRDVINLEKVETTIIELHDDFLVLRQSIRRMHPAFVWINLATLFEMMLLYVVFVAHGAWVNPGAVIIAFAIANTAGMIAALPGGIGVFEALMTTAFIAMGIPPGLALSVTLVFRVITLLLSLLAGGTLYQRAINKFGDSHESTRVHRR